MKKILLLLILVLPSVMIAQSGFSPDDYKAFIEANKSLTTTQLLEQYPPQTTYYSTRTHQPELSDIPWYDSVNAVFNLTADEKSLLKKNYFMVSERLNWGTWLGSFAHIYTEDLPMFLSTDFILFTLHQSYDNILKSIEYTMLEPNLYELLTAMQKRFQEVADMYMDVPELENSLKDVDLYITIALSLLNDAPATPYLISVSELQTYLDAIAKEEMTEMPLFTRSDLNRKLDFSQFTPRGHYTDILYEYGEEETLEDYFRAMMWLGRIDFLMTAPPSNPWEPDWLKSDLLRMNLSALILNEVLQSCGKYDLFQKHEEIVSFMVGPDDNLTPDELKTIEDENLSSIQDILDETTFDDFREVLNSSDDYGQKIMSNFFFVDPESSEPSLLPISFKLLGQKFLIDSYIFSEVVFDRIVHEGEKQYRMMPDPLDILSAFGNENALALMEDEMENYHYAYKISELQYLIKSYDEDFWTQSLYNTWLSAILELNPPSSSDDLPYFMQTTAWHHEKMNTQLTSWAQLRHDNILYGKQSYTGGTGCSFPYTYVEPYPEFYALINEFAEKASAFFGEKIDNADLKTKVVSYYDGYQSIISKLQVIAQKELEGTALNESELTFLKTMINSYMASGPSVDGWINNLLFYDYGMWDFDFTVADVHTQPTEPDGTPVGKVLHVGNGPINIGVFIAPGTVESNKLICYAGPVSSFHTRMEYNYKRLNDEEWEAVFYMQEYPARPDWAYHYLADISGELRNSERVLKGVEYTGIEYIDEPENPISYLLSFPNPATDEIHFRFVLNSDADVSANVYDVSGRVVEHLFDDKLAQGEHDLPYMLEDQKAGVYYLRLKVNNEVRVSKFIVN